MRKLNTYQFQEVIRLPKSLDLDMQAILRRELEAKGYRVEGTILVKGGFELSPDELLRQAKYPQSISWKAYLPYEPEIEVKVEVKQDPLGFLTPEQRQVIEKELAKRRVT